MNITREQYATKTEEFLGRTLTDTERDSIQECDCRKDYCSGWTVEVNVSPMLVAQPLYEV